MCMNLGNATAAAANISLHAISDTEFNKLKHL